MSSQLRKYKSLDVLIDLQIKFISDEPLLKHLTIYEYLLYYESELLLSVLKSTENISSIHDLYIITSISQLAEDLIILPNPGSKEFFARAVRAKTVIDILKFFKNRKVKSNDT